MNGRITLDALTPPDFGSFAKLSYAEYNKAVKSWDGVTPSSVLDVLRTSRRFYHEAREDARAIFSEWARVNNLGHLVRRVEVV
ncbi:MAG: hypothetical protein Q9218_006379 [Villophora microphyllina]